MCPSLPEAARHHPWTKFQHHCLHLQRVLPESSSPLSAAPPSLQVTDAGAPFILGTPVSQVLSLSISSTLGTWGRGGTSTLHLPAAHLPREPFGVPLCLVARAASARPGPWGRRREAAILAGDTRGSPRGWNLPHTAPPVAGAGRGRD